MIPLARSAIAVRSPDSISSCVSKRGRAPELVIARLTAAMDWGVRQVEDRRTVVLPEHPVIRLEAAAS